MGHIGHACLRFCCPKDCSVALQSTRLLRAIRLMISTADKMAEADLL